MHNSFWRYFYLKYFSVDWKYFYYNQRGIFVLDQASGGAGWRGRGGREPWWTRPQTRTPHTLHHELVHTNTNALGRSLQYRYCRTGVLLGRFLKPVDEKNTLPCQAYIDQPKKSRIVGEWRSLESPTHPPPRPRATQVPPPPPVVGRCLELCVVCLGTAGPTIS